MYKLRKRSDSSAPATETPPRARKLSKAAAEEKPPAREHAKKNKPPAPLPHSGKKDKAAAADVAPALSAKAAAADVAPALSVKEKRELFIQRLLEGMASGKKVWCKISSDRYARLVAVRLDGMHFNYESVQLVLGSNDGGEPELVQKKLNETSDYKDVVKWFSHMETKEEIKATIQRELKEVKGPKIDKVLAEAEAEVMKDAAWKSWRDA